MRRVMLLAGLNEIDLAVDATKARLAEIAEALKEPTALVEARRSLARAETDLAHCRAVQTELEAAQKGAADRLARTEKALYSGQVRNPKELADMEKDVQQLRRQLGQAEDHLLEALICTESATQAREEHAATLARLTAEWDARQVVLRGEQAQLKARLPAQLVRQAAAQKAVPADLLALYGNLRTRRGGRAVAQLDGDECSACLVSVPPTQREVARYGDELVYCGNCGRLLWDE